MTNTETYTKIKQDLEAKLAEFMPNAPQKLEKSIRYSLLNGGKRIRPLLFLSVLNAYANPLTDTEYKIATAIECIHIYSLIHDDLPILDNDDVRRGMPTNHIKFGEATALLAGDALLNYAYELLFAAVTENPNYIEAASIIAQCAGVGGMIGGQALEFENDLMTANEELLIEVYDKKCGKLILAAIAAGSAVCGKKDYQLWAEFGKEFGFCFQLKDDLLDAETQTDFATILRVWGKDGTEKELAARTSRIYEILSQIEVDTSFILSMVNSVLLRNTDGI